MTDTPTESDIRPIVRTPRRGLSNAVIVVLAVIGGVLLFAVLEARRQGASAPATTVRSAEVVSGSAIPPLYLPPEPVAPPTMPQPIAPLPSAPAPVAPSAPLPVTRPVMAEPYVPSPSTYTAATPAIPQRPARTAGGQALVLDNGSGATVAPAASPQTGEDGAPAQSGRRGLSTARVRAAVFANRATTVPQGTMIPAVLETAFDSTHAGFARALVQRDIRGFDGSQVLIPRGSRLIGEYGEDTAQGQRRAIILWTRLIRPDGVTVAIGSPTVDTLGRGGVKAQVDTHFLERFSGAILQSSLDLGIGLAARSARSPVLIALPGSIGGAGRSTTQPTDIKPTLRVAAGRSVSIFVARDLDFTGMDAVP